MAVQGDDEVELRFVCLLDLLAGQLEQLRIPHAPGTLLDGLVFEVLLEPDFIETHSVKILAPIEKAAVVAMQSYRVESVLLHEARQRVGIGNTWDLIADHLGAGGAAR